MLYQYSHFLFYLYGIDNLPIIVIIHATKYDNDPIQTIHIVNVSGNSFLNRGLSQSGIVKKNTKCIGQVMIHNICFIHDLPHG